jgi:hypothetical protein
VVDPADDVIVGGWIDGDFTVVKLLGSDGGDVWRQTLTGTASPGGGLARAVAVNGAGAVFAAGLIQNATTGVNDFIVVHLQGSDGAALWRREVDGTAGGDDSDGAQAVAVTVEGDAVAVGVTDNHGSGLDFAVVKMSEEIAGRQLLVQDKDGDPTKRDLLVRSQDRTIIAAPPGSGGDPTLSGGSLELWNAATGEKATFPLPAAHWKGLGTPAGIKGYKYEDRDRLAGPCQTVEIRNGENVRARCRGSQMTFSLDEPSQGSLVARLKTDALPFCMVFGGRVVRDIPAANGKKGVFKAYDAPIPADCPNVP